MNQKMNNYFSNSPLGLSLDIGAMEVPATFFDRMKPSMEKALQSMDQLEKGAIANPDEGRMVGHYWLRAPELAPQPSIRLEIEETIGAVKKFAADVHTGSVRPPKVPLFRNVLLIGIGGSALGPQFVADALGHPAKDPMKIFFLDNTDPDGMEKTMTPLLPELDSTLCIVVSKSGSTPETRNGMIIARHVYKKHGLDFNRHAVAVTGQGSQLDRLAASEGWLARFPMWDWVGGRTSVTSAVGLLPAALQGLDIDGLLAGAKECDEVTRQPDMRENPAALMALMWHWATGGQGQKDMVVLPYKDRLLLFARYLQQLVMESLGKAKDLAGNPVEQGLTVYGNKGSTDQHAYVQQLREGINNFFVTFIEILEDGGISVDTEVEPDISSGDYLHAFLLGTRQALRDNGRLSMTLSLQRLDAKSIGILIALFERAVGLYAFLININAYHQPGVEAGKKAATAILALHKPVFEYLKGTKRPMTAEEIAESIGKTSDAFFIYKILEHAAANGKYGLQGEEGPSPREMKFFIPR